MREAGFKQRCGQGTVGTRVSLLLYAPPPHHFCLTGYLQCPGHQYWEDGRGQNREQHIRVDGVKNEGDSRPQEAISVKVTLPMTQAPCTSPSVSLHAPPITPLTRHPIHPSLGTTHSPPNQATPFTPDQVPHSRPPGPPFTPPGPSHTFIILVWCLWKPRP